MQIYSCDICGRHCSRIHLCEAYGHDTGACDDCYDYEWEAYDEPADPLLHPKLDMFNLMFVEDALRNVERALELIVRDKPKPKGRIFQVDMELVHARAMLRAALHGNKP